MIDIGRTRGACLICGAGACACGPKTNVVAVDTMRDATRGDRQMKRYPNPTGGDGAFVVLNDRDAERAGFDPEEGLPHTKPHAEKSTAELQPDADDDSSAEEGSADGNAGDDSSETETKDETEDTPPASTGSKRRRSSSAANKAGTSDGDKSS